VTGDRGQGTGDRGQETGDRGQGTGDRRQGTGDSYFHCRLGGTNWNPTSDMTAIEII